MAGESRLRVCIALGKYPPEFTGHGIQFQRTLPLLRARGIDPTVLAYRLPPGIQAPREDARTIHRALAYGTGLRTTFARSVQLRRYFVRHGKAIDLLHNTLVGWEFLLSIPFLKRIGFPILVEMVLLDGDDPLTIAHERFGGLKLSLLRRVDFWIGISGVFQARLRDAGLREDRFRLIYTGVDVQQFRPLAAAERRDVRTRLGIPEKSRVAVTVGAVIHRKGMDRVVRAWERFRPVPGRDLLMIVGPRNRAEGLRVIDAPFAEGIHQKAASPGLQGTVRLIGLSDCVHEYLAAADVFIFLSRQEGLGTVILEAQACGLPCVVGALDGIAQEIVSEDVTGFILSDADDAARAADRLSFLLSNPARRDEMARAARSAAVRRFSLEVRADALTRLYREAVAQVRRGG